MAQRPAPGSIERASGTGHVIECSFVDAAGLPLAGVPYRLTLPDGEVLDGILCRDGTIRRDASTASQFEVALIDVRAAEWSIDRATVGETVGMSAVTSGLADGLPANFIVYRRRLKEADEAVAVVESLVHAGRVEGGWPTGAELGPTVESGAIAPVGGTIDFYFEVTCGDCQARSGALSLFGDLEVQSMDTDGRPHANADYVLMLPDGGARRGRLDAAGRAIERAVPAGACGLALPLVSEEVRA